MRPRTRIAPRCACAAFLLAALAGCAPGPMHGPHSAAPMNSPRMVGSDPSSGTVESARRELEGDWDLVSLEVAGPSGAARVPVAASGLLTYDAFGNLTIAARTTDPNAPVAAREVPSVSFKGRAVIDPVAHELKLMDVTGNVNPDEVLSPERRRKYAVTLDSLTLSSFDAKGQVTAVTVWHRRPKP